MVVLFRKLLLLLTLLWVATPGYSDTTARLERQKIQINDTVRLVVETNQENKTVEPDYSTLQEHFNIVGTSTSQNISIINGQQSSIRQWTVELAPKSIGSFNLGPIAVGNESTHLLRLAVLPEAKKASSSGAEVFIEVEVDAKSIYVQQQLIYTVKLFLAVELLDGSLTEPEPINTLVKQIGKDTRYETQRNNQTYQVFERRYGLFPQQSGKLSLPPVRFQGRARERSQSGRPYFNSIFNQGRRIKANSSTLEITVNPPAPGFVGTTWLPGKKLQVIDISNSVSEYTIGQPFTRKIQIQAIGLTGEQLPEIEIPQSEDIKLYPDKGVFETQDSNGDIVGVQQKNIAIIPNRTGEIDIPGYSVNWWNTALEKMETASIPGISITVTGDQSSGNFELKDTTPRQNVEPEEIGNSSLDRADQYNSRSDSFWSWKWIALASILLWVVTILIFVVNKPWRPTQHKKIPENREASEKQWRSRVKSACLSHSASDARAALVGWGEKNFEGIRTLAQLVTELEGDQLATEIAVLDRWLYADNDSKSNWSGNNLWQYFSGYRVPRKNSIREDQPLQPLFP